MRLRFTIRDLLWLTLVVALAFGWWLDHRRRFEVPPGMYLMEGIGESSDDELNDFMDTIKKARSKWIASHWVK